MAFPTDAVAYVWGDAGLDLNGGFFSVSLSTPGTSVDYTQQASSQVNPAAVLTTSGAGSTTLTWPGGSFTAAMVGNAIQITGGTNFQTGFYFITAYTSATAVTLDHTPSSGGAGSAGTGRVGGALISISKAVGTIGGVTAYVRKGTLTYGANITPAGGSAGQPTIIQGYNSTIGDAIGDPTYNNCPTVLASGSQSGFLLSSQFIKLRGFIVDGNNTGTTGVSVTAANNLVEWCYAKKWITRGFFASSASTPLRYCLATDCTSAATGGFSTSGAGVTLDCCVADRNACPGFAGTAGKPIYYRCAARNNTGSSSDGFQVQSGAILNHCLSDANGRDGLRATGAGAGDNLQYNNSTFRNNGVTTTGYGVNSDTTVYNFMVADFNSFYSNGAGSYHNVPAGTHDIVVSADPHVDAANGNYALNDALSAGAALTGAGGPATLPYISSATTTSSPDVGICQSARFGTADVIDGGIIS